MITFKINFARAFTITIICVSVFILAVFLDRFSQKNSIERGADKIIALCKDASYRPTCYDLEIPKLMGVLSMEDTFKVTRIIQDKESSYPYCHVLAHFIGGVETAKDPSKWKDVAARCPTDMCSNGCMHGVFQERFRSESLPNSSVEETSSIVRGICEPRAGWNKTLLEQTSCTHALGHLTMYVTKADTNKSLAICDKISINKDGYDFRPMCYDGVFMQLFQPLGPDDLALIEGKVPKKSEVEKFCSPFLGEQRNSCWSESWPLSRDWLKKSPSNVLKFCGKLPGLKDRNQCNRDIFYIMAVQFNLDEKKLADYCLMESGKGREQCFALAALRIMQVDSLNGSKAVNFCAKAENPETRDTCYGELSTNAYQTFPPGSKEFFNLCGGLPTKWRETCLSSKSQ